jgi:hypothetical protein
VVAYFNYVTRVADGVGIEDEPEWREQGWGKNSLNLG